MTAATSAHGKPAADAEASHDARAAAALPAPTLTLVGALVFLLGTGVLAAAFDADLPPRSQSLLFWSGLGLSLMATMAVGLRRNARDWERTTALAAFGALLYLPYVLRSPEYPIFGEDLQQLQSVRQLAETAHTQLVFPGLDLVALSLHDLTGLGLESVARIVPLTVHTVTPLIVFGIARTLGLGARTSFLAGLIYLANPAFFFLHSAFSPETLGMLLFLATWAAVVACAEDRSAAAVYVPAIAVLVAGTVVIDHLSALMVGLSFVVVAAAVALLERKDVARDAFALAAGSIVLLNLWLLVHATTAGDYVSAAFGAGIDGLVDSLELQAQGRDDPFTRQGLSQLDRIVGYGAPFVALVLCLAGMYLLWRRSWPRGTDVLLIALMVIGPVLWTLTAPVGVSGTSEIVHRTWPFLFLGVAIYAAVAARKLHGTRFAPWPLGAGLVLAVVGFLVAGGIVIGDNVGGRFPRPAPSTAAGPESVTDDAIAAARWLKETSGPGHAVLGDRGSELIFGSYGDQRPAAWNGQIPFVAETPDQIAAGLRRLGATHVVVDRRITELPPRFGHYFAPQETRAATYGQPFPRGQVRKLDDVRSLSLIYDNGNIAIYGPVAVVH